MYPLDISALSFEGLIDREWLSTNGLGGYASSTICGLNTRKYHGLLVAAMTPPVRRMVLLSHVDENIVIEGRSQPLSCNEYPGVISPRGDGLLRAFSAEPFPRWGYQGDGFTLEKSVRLLPGENTVCLTYTLLGGDKSVGLELRPKLALRGIHELMYQWNARLGAQDKSTHQVRITPTTRTPEIFFAHDGQFHGEPYWYLNTIYRREEERGYAGLEDLWMPGIFRWSLSPGQTVHLVCSTEPVELDRVIGDLHRSDLAAASPATDATDAQFDALVRAAGAFIISTDQENQAIKPVFVNSQYLWSAPSGRAAMIAFAGLFMVTGRFDEGRRLLLSLASQLRDGLILTEFPESGDAPVYNGADTSLWFINAVHDYWRYTGDESTVLELLPKLENIIDAYRQGTHLGIAVDAEGLLGSGVPGIPTSWMDVKLNDVMVTPRQGCTVELNALWHNALRITASLSAEFKRRQRSDDLTSLAQSVESAFNRRFWNAQLNCCFDVVHDQGADASVRPNQLLAISLPYPVLTPPRRQAVLQRVIDELLVPPGVRTLSRREPAYQGRYTGNVVSRDNAQHQGSAYPWLLGPLVTAHVRLNARSERSVAQARRWLEGCLDYLQRDGIGQLGELCDGDAPHRPGGAIASAVSIGEILRCYAQDILGIQPVVGRPDKPGPAATPPPGNPLAGARQGKIF